MRRRSHCLLHRLNTVSSISKPIIYSKLYFMYYILQSWYRFPRIEIHSEHILDSWRIEGVRARARGGRDRSPGQSLHTRSSPSHFCFCSRAHISLMVYVTYKPMVDIIETFKLRTKCVRYMGLFGYQIPRECDSICMLKCLQSRVRCIVSTVVLPPCGHASS